MKEIIRQTKVATKWVKSALVLDRLKRVHQIYLQMKRRKEEAEKRVESACKIVRLCKRFFRNAPTQWGKTFGQRIQKKISTSLLHLFFLRKDHVEQVAKTKMISFSQHLRLLTSFTSYVKKKKVESDIACQKFQSLLRRLSQRTSILEGQFLWRIKQWQKNASLKEFKVLLAKEDRDFITKKMFFSLQKHKKVVETNLKKLVNLINSENALRFEMLLNKVEEVHVTRTIEEVDKEIQQIC